MNQRIQGVRGMHDVLPDTAAAWRRLEGVLIDVLLRYGYRELRLPLVEHAELFERSIGEATDIVSKEMYSFVDRNDERLTLRPEGTAGCVRAVIEHGLLQAGALRLWYLGPMFRRERPQQGRYRQFHQLGAEAFGMPGPDLDAELIIMCARMWQELRIEGVQLEINSLGGTVARASYRDALVEYFGRHRAALDGDSLERLEKNPLRILDSKNPALAELIAAAPALEQHLDAEARRHFERLRELLECAGIHARVNPRLVRGLDYYSGTVFEWIGGTGAQSAICAGGRYDGLVQLFGGKPTAGAGFAIGLERVLALMDPGLVAECPPHVYLVIAGEEQLAAAVGLAEELRDGLPWLRLLMHCGAGSMKSQFRRADRSGAVIALVLGAEEIAAGTVGLKPLRDDTAQASVPRAGLAAELARRIAQPDAPGDAAGPL